ncbi:MAG: FdtA/QdtA family cupin domain-containing protein [Sandaracinaceae bacterium]
MTALPARRVPVPRPIPGYARPTGVDRCFEIDLQRFGDRRGDLVVAEVGRHLPFVVQRMYALVGVPEGAERGGHAHRALEQVMVVLSGGLDLVLDDGVTRKTLRVDDPTRAIYLRPMVWRELEAFAPNTVCMVLASEVYDEGDYLRDYEAFQEELSAWRGAAPRTSGVFAVRGDRP